MRRISKKKPISKSGDKVKNIERKGSLMSSIGMEHCMGKEFPENRCCSAGIVTHPLEPVYNINSKILILGTIPSAMSREANFYYMNPQNLFWKILSSLLNLNFPETVDEKKKMLIDNKIAVWDVLKSCEIGGSLDSTIRKPVPNDFSEILNTCDISAIFTTGTTATRLYKKLCCSVNGVDSIYLPSTSPANRKYYSYNKIFEEWKKILQYIERIN